MSGLIDPDLMRLLKYYGTVTLDVVVPGFCGFFFGRYLDTRFGTVPVLAALGFIVGAAGGFMEIYRLTTKESFAKGPEKRDGSAEDAKDDQEISDDGYGRWED